nr:hypothetical protein [Tanacetum cinerariifolium]
MMVIEFLFQINENDDVQVYEEMINTTDDGDRVLKDIVKLPQHIRFMH